MTRCAEVSTRWHQSGWMSCKRFKHRLYHCRGALLEVGITAAFRPKQTITLCGKNLRVAFWLTISVEVDNNTMFELDKSSQLERTGGSVWVEALLRKEVTLQHRALADTTYGPASRPPTTFRKVQKAPLPQAKNGSGHIKREGNLATCPYNNTQIYARLFAKRKQRSKNSAHCGQA